MADGAGHDDPARLASLTRRLWDAGERSEGDELLARLVDASLASGDTSDLLDLILRSGMIRPTIRRYLYDAPDIDEAEQITVIAVHAKLDQFRGEGTFRSWINTVAANEAKSLIRRESRHSDRAAEPSVDPDIEKASSFRRISSMVSNQESLLAAVDSLPENHRAALMLREFEDLDYQAVADRLDVPLSTAKTWVRRARQEVQTKLVTNLTS